MAGKRSPKFVVLSTLAVSAIYAFGYALSSHTNHAMAATAPSTNNITASTGYAKATSTHHHKQPPSKPSKPSVNTTGKYINGTYSGAAANQIGGVQVAVSVQSDKITNVQITACYTHFPEGYIDPVLPNYVTQHQTTQGPVVSGATLSSEDFYGAVQQALSHARNPNYKG